MKYISPRLFFHNFARYGSTDSGAVIEVSKVKREVSWKNGVHIDIVISHLLTQMIYNRLREKRLAIRHRN